MFRVTRVLSVLGLVLLLILSSVSLTAAGPSAPARDDDQSTVGVGAAPVRSDRPNPVNPNAVLFDNGPLVNSPGTGPGGADESLARNVTVGLTSRGFNASAGGSFRIADDFAVPSGVSWNINQITFYLYMGGGPPTATSPFTAVNYQIWDGPPDTAGSSVVFGDTTTNRLTNTSWANMYRRLESEPTDATRPVFWLETSAGVVLAPGHYYLDWQVDGDINYTGPWQPPVTIDGQTSTGDAQQQVGGVWQAVVDSGLQTALGVPFVIEGDVVGPTAVELSELQQQGPTGLPWLAAGLGLLVLAAAALRTRLASGR